MKKQIINIIYFIIFLFIGIGLLFFINSKNSYESNLIITNKVAKTGIIHNGKDVSEILNESNYKRVGINPNKYNTFSGFLDEFKSFSGVKIDPVNEEFSIAMKKDDGKTIMVPFNFTEDSKAFNDKTNKNLAILDIYQAYKDGKIYGGENKVLFDEDRQNPESFDLKRIWGKSANVNKMISELESHELGEGKKELLSYLYDFTGDYKKANEGRKKLCIELKDCKEIKLNISGKVLDQNSKPVSGAKIELLNDNKFYTSSKEDGTFSMDIKYFPFSHLRFKATTNGYSDGFNTYSLNDNIDSKIITIDFTLNKANNIVSVNSGTLSKYKKDKYYVIEDEHSKYMIPTDGLYYLDGPRYEGKNFEVYLYFFKKTDNTDNLLNNDTFEPVAGYVGNLMKTFGMPYIQFVDKDSKEELFVKSSNPMILQNHIYHMQELYENHDKIYTALTKEDMQYLVKVSKEKGGYPIDFDFLTTNNFLRWPAWWALDRKTGIWGNVGMRVLDESGLVELPFYSIKDN